MEKTIKFEQCTKDDFHNGTFCMCNKKKSNMYKHVLEIVDCHCYYNNDAFKEELPEGNQFAYCKDKTNNDKMFAIYLEKFVNDFVKIF